MNVKINIISHSEQRYPTCGDWYFKKECPICDSTYDPNTECEYCPTCKTKALAAGEEIPQLQGLLIINVSKLSDWRREMLVALHELREVLTCKHVGVTQEAVDNFDIGYEAARRRLNENDTSEPGDAPEAPYHYQHVAATKAERELADELGVSWSDYEKEIESLP